MENNSNDYLKPFSEVVVLDADGVILQMSNQDGLSFGEDLFNGGIF
jgi:hypothetical protein